MSLSQQRTTMGRCSNHWQQQQQQHRRQRVDQAKSLHRGGKGRSLSTSWMSTTVPNQVSTQIGLWSRSVTILYFQGAYKLIFSGACNLIFPGAYPIDGDCSRFLLCRQGRQGESENIEECNWLKTCSQQARQADEAGQALRQEAGADQGEGLQVPWRSSPSSSWSSQALAIICRHPWLLSYIWCCCWLESPSLHYTNMCHLHPLSLSLSTSSSDQEKPKGRPAII